MGGRLGDREVGSKGYTRTQEHAGALLKGRQHGYHFHPMGALLAGSWHESLPHFLKLDGCVVFSSRTEDGTYRWRTDGWTLNKVRLEGTIL